MGWGNYGFLCQGEHDIIRFKAGLLRGATVLNLVDDRATLALDQQCAEPTLLIRGKITHPARFQQTESTGLPVVSQPEGHCNLTIPVEFAGGLFRPFLPVEILDEQIWPFARTDISEGQAVGGPSLRGSELPISQVVTIMVPEYTITSMSSNNSVNHCNSLWVESGLSSSSGG